MTSAAQTEIKTLFESYDPGVVKNELTKLFALRDQAVVDETRSLVLESIRNREPWLVTIIVDIYVTLQLEPCIYIINDLTEPHEKLLFDRLNEHLKQSTRLNVFTLLSHVILKQPTWLYKIINHSLFNTILKLMKAETDVPLLLGAILFVTSLMPMAPVTISSRLADLNEIYLRLAGFQVRKPDGVPEVYLLHLNAGVYNLFHRLYGMYPFSFLTYLRNEYNRKENRKLFDVCVKPMLDRVKMHSFIITSTREHEVSVEKWRSLEAHDVLVDCAQFSLDSLESTGESSHCPVLPPDNLRDVVHSLKEGLENVPVKKCHRQSSGEKSTELKGRLGQPTSESIVAMGARAPQLMTSLCGLMTPPPDPSTRSASVLSRTSGQPTPHGMTDSPLARDEDQTGRSTGLITPGSTRDSYKRLSALSVSLAARPDDSAVPMSPLKPLFTAEPPLNAPKMTAVRKISFPADDDTSQPVHGSSGPFPIPARPGGSAQTDAEKHTPSMSELPAVIATLDNKGEECDLEVSELTLPLIPPQAVTSQTDATGPGLIQTNVDDTEQDSDSEAGSPSILPTDALQSAKSVQEFMRKVNRIRFNSMNVVTEYQLQTAQGRVNPEDGSRPNSAPDLSVTSDDVSVTPPRDRSRSQLDKKLSLTDSAHVTVDVSALRAQAEKSIRRSDDVTAASAAEKDTDVKKSTKVKAQSGNPESELVVEEALKAHFPYLHVYKHVFHAGERPGSDSGPLNWTFSPLDLLDRQLHTACDVHDKERHLAAAAQTTPKSDVSKAMSELSLARSQVKLLHYQLMFERHKREVHARRNRRLLGKIVHCAALEEENKTMRDQVVKLDGEVSRLSEALKVQIKENSDLKQNNVKSECRARDIEKNYNKAMDEHRKKTELLTTENAKLGQENERLKKFLSSTKAHVFNLEHELKAVTKKADENQILRDQIVRANRELLLMRELQQNYQQRLVSLSTSHKPREQDQLMIAALKAENQALRESLKQKSFQLENIVVKNAASDDVMKQKERLIVTQKDQLDALHASHKEQMSAFQEKYKCQRKIQQSLEAHILALNNEISLLQPVVRPQRPQVSAAQTTE